jgi:hypothetical protein
MTYRAARRLYPRRLMLLPCAAVLCAVAALTSATAAGRPHERADAPAPAAAPQHAGDRIITCKGLKGMEVSGRLLEEAIEKYRKGESISLGGIFYCREAFPTLQKYALDPDPEVRDRMTFYLRLYHTAAALQTLVRQIETYPTDKSAFPVAYAAQYPCYFFRGVKTPTLARALTARIKSREGEFKREEIYLLGCLAPHDAQARSLLEEMGGPSFMPGLGEQERALLSRLVTYALAEAGTKEAVEKVLAEIEAESQSGDPGRIESVMEELKQFTDCRILLRYARFITDKRPGREVPKIGDINDPKYKTDNGLVRLRVGDDAILRFASVYGTGVVGISESDFSGVRAFTDAEMDRIYGRVKRALEGGKFSTCRSSR